MNTGTKKMKPQKLLSESEDVLVNNGQTRQIRINNNDRT